MSKGGGGKKGDSGTPAVQNIEQSTRSEPWIAAQPYILQGLQSASALFGGGPPEYYPGNTIAPFSDQTMAGLEGIQANAGLPSELANTSLQSLMSILNRGGSTPGTANLSGMAEGTNDPFAAAIGQTTDTSFLDQFASGGFTNPLRGLFQSTAQQPVQGVGTDALRDIAGGGENPMLDQMFGRAATKVRQGVDEAFTRSGRGLSSSNYGDVLSENLGDLAGDFYGRAYESDAGRRLAAAGTLSGQEQGSLDRILGALGTEAGLADTDIGRQFSSGINLAGIDQADLARQLSALGMGTDTALQSFGALGNQGNAEVTQALASLGMFPDVYNFGNAGASNLIDIGQMIEGFNQANIDADISRHNYNQTAPQDFTTWFTNLASGLGGLGGQGLTQGQMPYQRGNPLGETAGNAASIASLIKIGMSLFGSDRRLKRNIRHVATDRHGLPWYEFEYRSEPGVVRFGVMADEAPRHAVHHVGGVAMVDYGALAREAA